MRYANIVDKATLLSPKATAMKKLALFKKGSRNILELPSHTLTVSTKSSSLKKTAPDFVSLKTKIGYYFHEET